MTQRYLDFMYWRDAGGRFGSWMLEPGVKRPTKRLWRERAATWSRRRPVSWVMSHRTKRMYARYTALELGYSKTIGRPGR